MSGSHRVVGAVMIAVASACSTSKVAQRADSVAARSVVPARTKAGEAPQDYVLVSYDDLPLPAGFELGDVPSCADTLVKGRYQLQATRWTHEFRYSHQCTARGTGIDTGSGTLRRSGDTLYFYQIIAPADTTWVQRGVLHGDTLRAGARLFDGPPEIYVRGRDR
jgi:hypothetical protein